MRCCNGWCCWRLEKMKNGMCCTNLVFPNCTRDINQATPIFHNNSSSIIFLDSPLKKVFILGKVCGLFFFPLSEQSVSQNGATAILMHILKYCSISPCWVCLDCKSITSFTLFCSITRHDGEGKGNGGYILLDYTKFYWALKDSSHSLATKGNDKVLDTFLPL